jgi:FkbM family methyltransferase
MLARSIELNPQLDICVESIAIGDEPGTLPFHLTSVARSSGLSSLRTDLPDADGEVISVSVETIDRYCETHAMTPDLIKLDVEGFELQALQGAAQTLGNGRLVVPAVISV